ncbi:kelch repeat-containing protein [Pseudomonas sp.]|uniref:Kelch repeat-containing protein n=1 Tax=Pseudomonas sp. TaxID=306 RepID=UPI002625BCCF|nr:kelch repeat-containing protein [Pseudomonas sp.]
MNANLAAEFKPTGSMLEPRYFHCAVTTGLGVLVVAGASGVELYDPLSGEWAARAPLPVARNTCGTALLSPGLVLVAAGSNANYALRDAQLYDVSADSWRAAGQLHTPRFSHTTTLLDSGEVLVVGGNNLGPSGSQVQDSVELYDPLSNVWKRKGWLPVDTMDHTATLLTNANVLVAGGYSGSRKATLASAFMYDTSTGRWTEVRPMPTPLMQHTATLLLDGRVLIAGGSTLPFGPAQSRSYTYDPRSDSWEQSAMGVPRKNHSAIRLAAGQVLVAGASTISSPENARTAELYDPLSGQWTLTAQMPHGRFGHSASCLPTGEVLLAGGARPVSHPAPVSSAEIFTLMQATGRDD